VTTTSLRPRPRWFAVGLNVAVAAGLVGWVLLLRPLAFGGPATYLVIHGNSMFPTYREGDLVVTRRQASYGVGEIVAYRVPQGQVGSGHLVIHRIIQSSKLGFVMKGDHNQYEDPWRPKAIDIVGSSWIAVSSMGRVLVLVRQPIVAATIAAIAAFYILKRRFPLRGRW
jgi:signal peptidase I